MVSKPHGGILVNRVASSKAKERLTSEACELPSLEIPLKESVDVENIAFGVFSPLEGFVCNEDYVSILYNMRLSNDIPWTIPIILDASFEDIKNFKEGDEIALKSSSLMLAVMNVEEIYEWDKQEYVRQVYKTTDVNHPGVARVYRRKDYLIGGKITLVNELPNPFYRYTLRPKETRILFREKGWKTIVGFQTRNAPHLGHEYVQKSALTFIDGLFINPLVGWKRKGDFKDEVILAAYNALIKYYYPKDAVVLAILRTSMRYAGPREAIHHAIIRKNFGCTHFIVGRDHAGVGNYYGPYEAQEMFFEFPDLGITPLFVKEFFYCFKCGGVVNEKICPHSENYRIKMSGTKIREMLKNKKVPPETLMRPEVAKTILSFENPFIEDDSL